MLEDLALKMWSLILFKPSIQVEFAKSIGEIDLSNLTDDFVEDVMLQSKPLQSILHAIRKRQKVHKIRGYPKESRLDSFALSYRTIENRGFFTQLPRIQLMLRLVHAVLFFYLSHSDFGQLP